MNATGAPRWRVDILLEAAAGLADASFLPVELAPEPARARDAEEISAPARLGAALGQAFGTEPMPRWIHSVLRTLVTSTEPRAARYGEKKPVISRAGFGVALPRLGALTVEIALHEGNVSVAFVTSDPATAALLEADRGELARALARTGLGLSGLAARAVVPRPVLEAARRIEGWT